MCNVTGCFRRRQPASCQKSGSENILVIPQTGLFVMLQDNDEDPLDAFMAEQINPEVAAAERAEAEARERRRVEQAKQIAVSQPGGLRQSQTACTCGSLQMQARAAAGCKQGHPVTDRGCSALVVAGLGASLAGLWTEHATLLHC